MNIRQVLAAPLVVFALVSSLHADEEEFLIWNEVRIVCPKRDDTGQVVFHAKAEEGKLVEMTIEAFGKKHSVPKENLATLAGFPLSSLVTTHSAGYELVGGHMVVFKLKRIFYDADKKLVEEKAMILVTQGKGLSVRAPTRTVLKE